MKIKNIPKNVFDKLYNMHEVNVINEILEKEDFIPIVNKPINKINKLCFVILAMNAYQGGHTSILRLGTYLAKFGVEVFYACVLDQSIESLENNAKINLSDYQGTFIKYNDALNMELDVIVATSWRSVYWAKKLSGYKTYFVQDYEPYFFKIGERFFLAKKTYELGFHIISLGPWNIKQIENNCIIKSKLDYIDFPYEKKEYTFNERFYSKYNGKKSIKLAVYAKEEGKRLPNLIQSILINASNTLKENYNIALDINFFGFEKNYKVKTGKNLGKLSKKELSELYSSSDFGMVASMSNISLVPYEMIASGLPVIEFKDGSFSDFFPKNSAILIDYNSNTLVNELLKCIENPKIIEDNMNTAKKYISNLSWKKSSEQFYNILKQNINN